MKKLLVMGVGNTLLTDEGLGVHAVNALSTEDFGEGVHLIDGGTFTQDIFYLFEGYEGLLVLDIVKSGKKAGTISLFTEEDLVQNEKQRLSLHDIDLLDSLRMAGLVGKRPKMRIVGMEPKDFTSWGESVTPEIAAYFPDYLSVIRQEIKRFLADLSK